MMDVACSGTFPNEAQIQCKEGVRDVALREQVRGGHRLLFLDAAADGEQLAQRGLVQGAQAEHMAFFLFSALLFLFGTSAATRRGFESCSQMACRRWQLLTKSVLGVIFAFLTPRQVARAHLVSTHWRACAFWRSLRLGSQSAGIKRLCEPLQVAALEVDDFADAQLEPFKNLQLLTLRGGCSCLKSLSSAHFEQLAHLEIVSVFIRLHLPSLRGLSALQTLKVRAPTTSLEPLGALKNLQSLWLYDLTGIGKVALHHLYSLTALIALHLMDTLTAFSSEDFIHLLESVGSRLQTLEVVACHLSDAFVPRLCPALRELVFDPSDRTTLNNLSDVAASTNSVRRLATNRAHGQLVRGLEGFANRDAAADRGAPVHCRFHPA